MTRMLLVVLTLAVTVALSAVPALADHRTLDEAAATDLDIDLRLGGDGFRLGGRLFGLENFYGAWLNGRLRADGFSLDGRLQRDGRAFNFKLDAELTDPLSRFPWRWWLGQP
jgi:hypothetical protein